MAREILGAARERIIAAEKAKPVPAFKPFLDASRAVYERGRQAYEKGDYNKAVDLAAAAEAWTHIGEHLKRGEGVGRPQPARP
jgi:hypothetical protein